MPSHRHHEPGDLYVQLTVKFPDNINPAMIPQLEAALPPRVSIAKYPKSTVLEEVEMSDMDARQQRAHANHAEPMDEDEDGQPRVQCAQQ